MASGHRRDAEVGGAGCVGVPAVGDTRRSLDDDETGELLNKSSPGRLTVGSSKLESVHLGLELL